MLGSRLSGRAPVRHHDGWSFSGSVHFQECACFIVPGEQMLWLKDVALFADDRVSKIGDHATGRVHCGLFFTPQSEIGPKRSPYEAIAAELHRFVVQQPEVSVPLL